jgi:hypothetical protein
VAEKKKTKAEIVSEMTSIIVGHLETMPTEERKQRIGAFKEVLSRDEKRGGTRPKAASAANMRDCSRRTLA